MNIPLFPLNTVLFPGGILPLRIFETRYIDMARGCLRESLPFGVCLIARGRETGETAEPESVGCLATIEFSDMPHLGLLHVRAHGGDRFRILSTHRQADRLLRGEVEVLDGDEDSPVAPQYQPCRDLLQRVINDLASRAGEADQAAPFAEPYQLDSSVWVGNRLCEVLPVPLKAKQKLMELDDAATRLEILTQYLKQHAVIK
jgi:uncharacterized protein